MSNLLRMDNRFYSYGDSAVGDPQLAFMLDADYWQGDPYSSTGVMENLLENPPLPPEMIVAALVDTLLEHLPTLRTLRLPESERATISQASPDNFGAYAVWYETLMPYAPIYVESMQGYVSNLRASYPDIPPSTIWSDKLAAMADVSAIYFTTAQDGEERTYAEFRQEMLLALPMDGGFALFSPSEFLLGQPKRDVTFSNSDQTPKGIADGSSLAYPDLSIFGYAFPDDPTERKELAETFQRDILLANVDHSCFVYSPVGLTAGQFVAADAQTLTGLSGTEESATTCLQRLTHIFQLD